MSEEKLETKQCKNCKEIVSKNDKKCKHCGANTGSWFGRHGLLTGVMVYILFMLFIAAIALITKDKNSLSNEPQPSTPVVSISEEEYAAIVKAKAEEKAAFDKTPAGKICNDHPNWSRDDCQGVVDKKLWIGMSYEMLVEEVGKPNSANPSNYGDGTRWQWCWYDLRPSCFYDDNGDGLVDAYN